jgi:NAD(P)-dependent dehydrogenase (short-subunit alcohol dehydrogenase family)
MQVKDSIAVITGGASGLGESCVRSLSALGAKVAILDVVAERGEKLAALLAVLAPAMSAAEKPVDLSGSDLRPRSPPYWP